MITKIIKFLSATIIFAGLVAGCCLAKGATVVPPLTFQNDTGYMFTAYVNDGNFQLPNIPPHGGQTYTWAQLKSACYMGSCEMLVSVVDSSELLYVILDPVKQEIDQWEQMGESDVCIQEKNNTFHLFPGCAKK